jgi:hypothetical protein
MLLAGHQPEYLPYIGFVLKAMSADVFMLVDHVQYGKKQFQNRNRIRTAHGSNGWSWLTVPVLTHGAFDQRIAEVKINNEAKWRDTHFKSIYLAYRRSPFFNEYISLFEQVYSEDWKRLAPLDEALIRVIFKILNIETRIIKSSDYNIAGEKTEMLVDMCQKVGADSYISGQGGRLYVDEAKFKAAGLFHQFCEFEHPVYPQNFKPFVSHMSVIDLIFNIGPASREMMRKSKKPVEEF